jgi:parallel beta-helix repeat protein
VLIRLSRIIILSASIFLLTIPYGIILPAHAAAAPTLFISPASRPLAPRNSLVTFNVSVSNMPAFAGWDIIVKVGDRSVLYPLGIDVAETFGGTLVEVSHCIQGAGSGCGQNDGGGVLHSGGYSGSSTDSGNVTLFKVTFNATATTGYTFLSLPSPSIIDLSANDITPAPGNIFGATYGNAASAPVAQFSWSPLKPFAGDQLTLNASLSSDPSGGTITTYDWGTQLTHIPIAFEIFQSPGPKTITLTVTDDKGLKSPPTTHVVDVLVKPPPCQQGLSIVHVPSECPTISAGIDSVVPGGTILVAPGHYREDLSIYKSLRLQGSGRDSTFMEGNIYLATGNTTITGLTVGCIGVFCHQIQVLVSGYLSARADGNIIANNTIVGSLILQDVRGTILTNNRIASSFPYETVSIEGELQINSSPNSLLRGNVLENNSTLSVFSENVADYFQDIDNSNTINGKPIYYLIGVHSSIIPQAIGFLALVKSSNVTIGPVSIDGGVLLVATRDVKIDGLRTISGVTLFDSYNTLVQNSTVVLKQDRPGILSGLVITSSDSTVIQNNALFDTGVRVTGSNNTRILDNRIVGVTFASRGYGTGMALFSSQGDVLAHNNITNFYLALDIEGSTLNLIEGNVIQDTPLDFLNPRVGTGVFIFDSPQNTFRDNEIKGAFSSLEVDSENSSDCAQPLRNFGVTSPCLVDYVQDINTSNTIDGKPVYYLVGANDERIPPNAGYVAIVNSTKVEVVSPNLEFAGDGIHVLFSANVLIQGANVTSTNGIWGWGSRDLTITNSQINPVFMNYEIGILLENCSQINVVGNLILPGFQTGIRVDDSIDSLIKGNFIIGFFQERGSSIEGISLRDSNNNTIDRNMVVNYLFGVLLGVESDFGEPGTHGSFNNLVIENTIAYNGYGLEVSGSGNTIYHNNFVNNFSQASGMNSTWDNGAGQGNYWSDYKGQDLDGDGVGDTLLPHLGLDNYPLMTPWTPSGLAGTFVGRGAWGHVGQTGRPVKSDVVQRLFAAARNNGRAPEWMQAVFNITSPDGVTQTLFTIPVWVSTGQSVILSAPILLSPGTYSVSVQLRFSADAFLKWTVAGTRTFSVNVR